MTEECVYVREQGMKGMYSLQYGTMQQEVLRCEVILQLVKEC